MKTLRLWRIALLPLFFSFSSLILSAQTYTFTSAGAVKETGPTQVQIDAVYSSTTLDGQVTAIGGIQYWVVPATGSYKIEAMGASGGGTSGGLGAKITGEFLLMGGDTLLIIVGQQGIDALDGSTTGGGGSFIVLRDGNSSYITSTGRPVTPLVIAGGGGGNPGTANNASNANTSGSGNDGAGGTSFGYGGTSGNGGEISAVSSNSRGGGGGGFLTDGDRSNTCGTGSLESGYSFLNGGQGGAFSTCSTPYSGGFGGGGGSISSGWRSSGGGGGYSGGGGGQTNSVATDHRGGGGGSFNAGLNPINVLASSAGDGLVIISTLSSGASNDIGVISIDSPNVYCPGLHNVVATIQNFGISIVDSVTLDWSVDGIAQTPAKFIGTLDTFGGTGSPAAQAVLGGFNFSSSPHVVKVWSSMPNGMADTSNANDTTRAIKESSLPPPTGLSLKTLTDSTATIKWVGGSTSNSWLYVNLPYGITPSGIGSSTSADSARVTGLTRVTTYDFYVREVCPTGDTSMWAGPLSFQTPCSTPLNGTYTIDPGQPVSVSNFVSMGDALEALNKCGVSGAITFNVAPNSGPYTAGAELTAIPGASATNTVTFNGNDNILNEGAATYFVALDGVSYLTINDFRFINTNPATPMFGIMIRGGSHHINITNNLIDMGMDYTSSLSAGIALSNSTTSATTAGNNGQYIMITGNEIAGAYYGVTLVGQSSYADNYGHVISNNNIHDFYVYGVYMVNADTIVAENNNLNRSNRSTISTFYGFYLSTARGVKIRKNEIHGGGIGSYTAYPIYVTTSVNNSSNKTEIVNNTIYDNRTTSTYYGMYLLGTRDYINIYHNTIDLVAEGTGTKRGLFFSTAPNNHDLKNNIVSVTGDGTGTKHLIYVTTTSTTFTSNNNDWYLAATAGTNSMGYWTATRTALSDWQTNASQDANSVDFNPYFANSAAGNLTPLNVAIDNIGSPVGVLTDISNTTRSTTTPDAGANEFTGLAGDIALISGEFAIIDICYNTADTAEFVISNLFGSTANFATNPLSLVWKVTGPVNSSDTIVVNSGTLAAGATMNIATYSLDMTAPGTYYLTAYLLPNADNPGADNDTLTIASEHTVVPILSIAPQLTTLTSFSDSAQLTAVSPLIISGSGLTTSWASNNGSGGNYFDIKVNNSIVLTGFEVNNSSTSSITYSIYYRTGSYVGHESNSSGWNSLGSFGVTGAGLDNPTDITLGSQLLLLPDTYAFYIVTTNGGHRYIGATGATVAGAVWASNSDLTIFEGLGSDNILFSTTTFSPRNFSGRIKYAPPSQVVSGLMWKEGSTTIDSTRAIWVGPYSTHGIYTYVASYTNGCGTFTDTATVIMPPRVDMALKEVILPAQECQQVSLPVEVKISNASLVEAIDFSSDTATVVVNVTGAAIQSYSVSISNNSLNSNQPLGKNANLIIPLGNLNLSATGTYYFSASVVVNGDGEASNNVLIDSLVVKPTPVVNAGMDQKVCPGATVMLNGSAGNGTGFTYSWTPGAGLSAPTIANPTFTASVTQALMLTVSNAEGCTSSDNVLVEMSDVAADAGPDFLACSGSAVGIGITNGGTGGFGMLAYSWSPGAVLSDSTLNKPIATVPASTVFTLTVTDSLGCTATDAMEVQVALPSPMVTGPNTACGTHTGTYSTSLDAGTTYQWQVTGGTISGSSTGNSVDVIWNTSGSGSVKVTQTIVAGGCFKTTPDYNVTINPLPSVAIFPVTPTTICQGENATLVTIPASGVSLQWKRNGVDISGATSSTLKTTLAGDYKLIATSATGCKDSSSIVSIVVNSAPTATITPAGSTTFCTGSSVQLNANTATGLSYQWMRNTVVIASATSSSYTTSTAGDYQVKVTNANGCEATSSIVTVTVNSLPSASISASGSTTFCQGGNVVLAAFTATGYSYQWRQNGSDISGATSGTLNVTTNGNYDVRVSTAQSCSLLSNSISVTVNTLPSATATAAGSTTFCEGGNVVINANTGSGLTYSWMNQGTTIPGATASSYMASQSGNYSVRVTNSNSCSNVSSAVAVTVNPMPFVAISAVGNTTICAGDHVNIISISSGAGSFQWLRNGSSISGATSVNYSATDNGLYRLRAVTGQGCADTSNTVGVNRNALPDSSVTASGPLTFCAGGGVMLTATATSGVTYQWQRDASNIPNARASSYNATTSGDYSLVIINSSSGCVNISAARKVSVLENPVADFTATNGCFGDSMSFANNTSGAGTMTYTWSFGDGNNSTAGQPKHLYAAAGPYQVTLMATSPDGCTNSQLKAVAVYPQPQVSFTVNDACDGESVNFSNTSSVSSGSLASFSWNFGDGRTSISVEPSHIYAATGTYDITLAVTTLLGCKAEKMNTVVISPKPVADFTVANGCFGESTMFTNQSTISTGTIIYSWMLGDGSSSTDMDPVHTYGTGGTFNVQLTATSGVGCSSIMNHSVQVYALPVVHFSASDACEGDATAFTNASTTMSDTMEFEWDFGDGRTSTDMDPDHVYAGSGSYDVMLKVMTENGCMDSMMMTVEVYANPDATFTRSHMGNGLYEFTPTVSGLDSYSWDFGDGSTGSDATTTHQYPDFGTYHVTLTVRNGNGCESTSEEDLEYATGIEDEPEVAGFINVYPNPYRESTNIVYELEKTGKVLIEVYTMEGKLVQRLANETQQAGEHRYSFSGRESGLASGSFFIRFTIDGHTYMKQIVKVK